MSLIIIITDLLVVACVESLNSIMTKKLEELFDLNSENTEVTEDITEQVISSAITNKNNAKLDKIMTSIDKIDSALPMVRDLEANDLEMDSIATKAVDTFNDLMDLGMNVEARYAGKIFEVAGTMMKNAIDARAAKIDKKLRMVELQIKKQRVDQQGKELDPYGDTMDGEATIVADRNELIKQILNQNNDKHGDKK